MINIEQEADGIYRKHEHYSRVFYKSPYYKMWNLILPHLHGKIIDLGCGPGQFLDMCAANGFEDYTGYDISQVAIDKCNEIITHRNYESRVKKVNLLETDAIEYGSVYVMSEILEHIEDDHKILSLIPTGSKVIITLPNFLGGSHVRKFETRHDISERFTEIEFDSFYKCQMGKDTHITIAIGIKK